MKLGPADWSPNQGRVGDTKWKVMASGTVGGVGERSIPLRRTTGSLGARGWLGRRHFFAEFVEIADQVSAR